MLSPLQRKSITDITRRKLRTALVVVGIAAGVTGLTAINLASSNLGAGFSYSQSRAHAADLGVSVAAVDPALGAGVAGLDGVQAAQVETLFSTRWKIGAPPGHANMSILAPDPAAVKLASYQLTSGRQPGTGEVVMESSNRALAPFNLGDTIQIGVPAGTAELKVVGTARTLGLASASFSSRARAYMSPEAIAAVSGIKQANLVEVRYRAGANKTEGAQRVTSYLTARGVRVVGAFDESATSGADVISGLFTILNVLSVVALLLTGFLMLNTVTTVVAEQTAVIGIMKALGATRAQVMRSYLQTVLVYGVLGTAAGLSLGILAGNALTEYIAGIATIDVGPLPFNLPVMALAVAVGLGVPMLAALPPLWSGTGITVREAITAYGISASGRRSPVGSGWAFVPQTVWLGLRGLFRRRARAGLTLAALTFSATAFLAIQTTTHSFGDFLDHLFGQYSADIFASVGKPAPAGQLAAVMHSVPGVSSLERFQTTSASTRWGTVLLTGTEHEPTLYRRNVIAGRWFQPGESHVLLPNEVFMAKAGLHIGDSVELTGADHKETWRVIGEVRDFNGGIGTIGVALTSVGEVYRFEDQPQDYAGGFLVRTTDRSPAVVDATANRLDSALSDAGLAPSISTSAQQISRNQNQISILYFLLYAVAAIVALVGILGLFNTLTSSVLERRREIGILRSMGATGRRVAAVFLVESAALALLGWLVAVVIGIPAAFGFVQLIAAVLVPIGFAFDPTAFLEMLGFTLLMAALAAFIPAISASRLRIAQILRYE